MTATTTDRTDAAFARLADGLLDTIGRMVDARVEYAAAHNLSVTDDEIVTSVRDSLVRLLATEVSR